jgi:outer membrane lipoprotein carrier protein
MESVTRIHCAPVASQPGRLRSWWACLWFLGLCGSIQAADPNHDSLLATWLSHQTNIHSITADFVQTRKLKALTDPLVARGRLWFEMPNRFRWELGQPAQTIIVKDASQLLMISPRLKRAERYPMDGSVQGPWNDALSLLESGFPKDVASFRKQYHLISVAQTNGVYELQLQPTSTSARRMITRMGLVLDATNFILRANHLTLADGSSIRNDFENLHVNPELDPEVFKGSLGPDYKITEPWKK